MFRTFIANIRTHRAETQFVRLIAKLTDQELADIGGHRLDARLLAKALRHRLHEKATVAVPIFPTA